MSKPSIETVINEITQFISNKMNAAFSDLIVQSDEYEETKTHILNLPFVRQIINENIQSRIVNVVQNECCKDKCSCEEKQIECRKEDDLTVLEGLKVLEETPNINLSLHLQHQ